MLNSYFVKASKLRGLFAAVASLAMWATAVQASTISEVTLDIGESVKLDLLTSGEIPGVIVGDKLFKEFVYSWGNNMPAPENVNVTAIIDSANNYGLRFQGTFVDLPGDNVGSDASLAFTVHVLDELFRISDAHLKSAIFLDENTPGSFGSIDESFLGNSPSTTETMSVHKSTFGQGSEVFEDEVVFNSTYEWLHVQKDIFALAAEDSSQPVRMTFFDQTFSQTVIPEPSALTLSLLLGCATVVCTSRRSL